MNLIIAHLSTSRQVDKPNFFSLSLKHTPSYLQPMAFLSWPTGTHVPLTRFLSADLPPTLPINKKVFSAVTAVAPTSLTVEQPILMIALCDTNNAYFVKPGEQDSVHKQLPFSITSALFFKGWFYCTDISGSIWEIEPEQKSATCVFSQDAPYRCWDLVQTRTEMLLVDSERMLEGKIEDAGHNLRVYKVDLSAKTIIATNDIRNYAIFVGDTVQKAASSFCNPYRQLH